jgi:predicted XRE-type DNA-binding protein
VPGSAAASSRGALRAQAKPASLCDPSVAMWTRPHRTTALAAWNDAWPEALGIALSDWRRAQGMSQQAVARRAGVTRSTWVRWELGDPTRPVQLSPLARAGVPVAELVRWAATLTDSDRLTGRFGAP